jgi:hypothetical protein
MKKYILILTLLALSLINYSCDQSINPNAPFRERFILNGIIKSDTSYQIVTLTHSYQPDGLSPLDYTDDPAIKNADVNIYYDNKLYRMRDTVVARVNSSRYSDSVKYYYNPDLKPGPGKVVEIDALLPNGLLLQSESMTPPVPDFGFFDYKNDKLIPPSFGTTLKINWQGIGNFLYAPHIAIDYYVKGDTLPHQQEVPLFYYSDGGNLKPVYPTPIRKTFLELDLETINQALNEIPSGGRPKSDYSITDMKFELLIYDEYLSTYYSSVKQGLDGFTVKLDNPDYSNIKGGLGIFGSYIKTSYTIGFKPSFLQSLGFK